MSVVDVSNTVTDYSKSLGLTYKPAQYSTSYDENMNATQNQTNEAGYWDDKGVYYSPDQAAGMASAVNRKLYPNITNPNMYVDYNKLQNDPANVVGALTRAQWEDYQLRFQPKEDQLMNMTSYKNPAVVGIEVDNAIQGAQRASEVSQGVASRNFARYGLTMDAARQTATNRANALAASTASVDAANRARFGIMDRDRAIAVGASPNAGRSYGLRSESMAE